MRPIWMDVQCFLSSVVGVTGSSEAPQMAWGEWADTGSEMHHVCESEDHQLLPSANKAEEVSELHTQMASKARVNSMRITENLRSAHCVDKAVVKCFVDEQTGSFLMQTKRNTRKQGHTVPCSRSTCLGLREWSGYCVFTLAGIFIETDKARSAVSGCA